ncbi:Lipopolysaccharide biosynthesis [hydrothermal vent metagenome]|uniref:Lipopolysaccharide biosynthesis n=1 Tax=hydrothermal vent metagenome TaxID=652676 RepID=A0A3B1E5G0_9ZZZZ
MQETNAHYIDEDEIDLRELFKTILKNKFKIALITFIITSLTILYTLSIPNSYKSSVVLDPQDQPKSAGLGGLSALAGMAGVSLGVSSMNTFNSMKAVLNDNAFQEMVIKKYKLTEKLTPEYMDKNLVFALGFRSIYDIFKSDSENDKSQDEIMFDTIKTLKKIVSLSNDEKSGAISMSVEMYDRFLAKEILDIYLKELTTYLQKIDMQDINKKLKYYKSELEKVDDIELKIQISQLMSSLIQKKVLSSASEYYNVKVMTQSQVAFIKDKSKPKRALIVIVSFITSIILSIFFVFFMEFLKENKEEVS